MQGDSHHAESELGVVAPARAEELAHDVATRIEVAGTWDRVEALREQWSALGGAYLENDLDRYRALVEFEPSIQQPRVLSVHRGGELVALLVGRIEEAVLGNQLGYKRVYGRKVQSLTIPRRGYRGDIDAPTASLLISELLRILDSGDVDVVIFRGLEVGHELYVAATKDPPLVQRQVRPMGSNAWQRPLPDSFDEFWRSLSKSTRKSLKGKVERDFAGRFDVERYTRPDQLDDYFSNARIVGAKSYQSRLGDPRAAIGDDPARRRRVAFSMEHGWFRGYILFLDGQPVAHCSGEAYGDRFTSRLPAYDPAFSKYGVGNYLRTKMIEDLCAETHVRVLDLGVGESGAKVALGATPWREEIVVIYARRFRPLRINLVRSFIKVTNDALAAAVRPLGGRPAMKKRWRTVVMRRSGSKT